MKRTILLLLLLVAGLGAVPASAQLLSPEAFLGYGMGDRFTYHHRAVDYVEHVAAQRPDAVRLIPYGSTNEGRPLLLVAITSPANMARLEEIRLNNLRRAGLAEGEPTDDGITLVWLSHNIHGNESVSLEAALLTLWKLADPTNAESQGWLENTVVLLDPTVNPDGRDRYAVWYHQMMGTEMDVTPFAREHREPWPGGRANHYLFDLNRDWAWQTQVESRQRGVVYQQWLPHVHADFHEMGAESPYYFAPAAAPYHEAVTPFQRSFQVEVGQNHARYFDGNFWLYFTKEVFDLFYPSYGDTWPTYQGAIGMTYEQGGSGYAGLGVILANGDTLTLKDRIAHQHLVGMSTVEVSARNAAKLANEFKAFYDKGRNNPDGAYKTYLVRDNGNPDQLKAFLSLLDLQGIRYGLAPARRTANGFDFATGRTGSVNIGTDDVLISLYQPKSTLAHVLMEPRTTIVDSLTYDITAWSLPYVYNLQAWGIGERINPRYVDVMAEKFPEPAADMATQALAYAYLVEWKSLDDVRFMADLMQQGVQVRSTEKSLTFGGKTYAPGTLVVTRTGNERHTDFDRRIRETAARHRRVAMPVYTGFAEGGVDIGSGSVRHLPAPKVGILAGEGVSSLQFGEVWHFFDQQIGYPATTIHLSDFGRVPLHQLDVLVLPNGNYRSIFSGDTWDRVQEWMRNGGVLIAMEGVVDQLAGTEAFGSLDSKEPEAVETPLATYGAAERESMRESLAGGIFKVRMDATHPLGFGYPNGYYSLKTGGRAYAYMDRGWNVGTIPADGFVSGFVGHRLKPVVLESLVFGHIPQGRGAAVVMVDNPLFRAFWEGGKLVFANAVFQVGN